jgi:hypothetical protein
MTHPGLWAPLVQFDPDGVVPGQVVLMTKSVPEMPTGATLCT